jgi:hypothetical protein
MTNILALTIAAALAQPAPPQPRPALSVQMTQIAAKTHLAAPVGTPAVQAKRDSLWNGALTGGIIGGVAMAAYGSRTCEDQTCIAPVALWSAIAAGAGAAIGAGVDALFRR